jgi:thioredoxin 1
MATTIITLTKSNFDETINKQGVCLVDFWAAWCGPCKAIAPTIEQIADEYKDKATVGKLNIDEQIEIAQKYDVMSIPTLIYFKDGKQVERLVGLEQKEKLTKLLDKHI